MTRHYGLGHYQKMRIERRYPRAFRLGLALAIGAAVGIAALMSSAHSAPIICDKQGCSDRARQVRMVDANGNRVLLGGRPEGCPYAYCGCGLRKFLGLNDKRLNRAWSWAEMFPHTHAHPGAIAVRRHHVMQLVRHLGGSKWLVRSYNDYRRKSWLIDRSVRGFIFVDAGQQS